MQKIYLLDTNVISEMTKPVQNQNVIARIFQTQKQSALCSVTWGEALYGVKRMPEGKRKDFIMDFYIDSVQKMYSFVDFDIHAASIYSDIKMRLEKIKNACPVITKKEIAEVVSLSTGIPVARMTEEENKKYRSSYARLDFYKEGDEWNAISKYNKKLRRLLTALKLFYNLN